MNQQRKITAVALRVIAILLIAAGAVSLTAFASAEDGPKKLSGSWDVAVVSNLQGPFPGLLTFNADGGLIGDPPPIGTESTSHGNWIRTGPKAVAYTFVALITNDQRVVVAKLKVVGTLQYEASTDTWSGPYQLTVSTPDGTVVLGHDGGTFRLTRIAVEALS
jgi:hypothetical protein